MTSFIEIVFVCFELTDPRNNIRILHNPALRKMLLK